MSLTTFWHRRAAKRFKKQPTFTLVDNHIHVRGIKQTNQTRHEFVAQFMSTNPLLLCHVKTNDLRFVDLLITPHDRDNPIPEAWLCESCRSRHKAIIAYRDTK